MIFNVKATFSFIKNLIQSSWKRIESGKNFNILCSALSRKSYRNVVTEKDILIYFYFMVFVDVTVFLRLFLLL